MSAGTVEWHQEQRTIRQPRLGAATLEIGQTRDGEFWIAPLGTPPPPSYPPPGEWCYIGKARSSGGT